MSEKNLSERQITSCEGKIRHSSYWEAKKYQKKSTLLLHVNAKRKKKLSIYKCSFCGGFHAGKKLRKQNPPK